MRRWTERFGRGLKISGLDPDEPDDEAVQSPSTAEKLLGGIRDRLLGMLSTEKAAIFSALMDATTNDSRASSPPKFDLKLVQLYVVGRVFELGWTTERFGEFDQHMPDRGRDPGQPERIGKKYQWIAYHEMLAFMADRYQYAAGPRTPEIGTAYQGSWQDNVRDIDPSNVMEALIH